MDTSRRDLLHPMKYKLGSESIGMQPVDSRTRVMLEGPIVQTLLRLAWPNILVTLAQSSTGLIELWFVAHLGANALTGMALVTPVLVMMQNMSQGSMGGGIASAIARALGAGRRDQADSCVFHALLINGLLALLFMIVGLLGGPTLYRLLGGTGASFQAALIYSDILFAGMVPLWIFNAFAAAIRGTGNMLVPGFVICGGALFLIPLSPCLIFGFGPVPAMGIAGGGAALIAYYTIGTCILGWYVLTGRNAASLRRPRFEIARCREILSVGIVGIVNVIQINATIATTMGMVAARDGPGAVAGFGTGTRLEYLMPPLAFGFGASLVALVGANIGAMQTSRALRFAFVGAALAFLVTEPVGLWAAIWPRSWLLLFGSGRQMVEIGSTYLQIVGPFFGFFAVGITLYFASQGAGRLGWPLFAGLFRMVLAIGGGWLALHLTGSVNWFLTVYAGAMFLYGLIIASAVAFGRWRPERAHSLALGETEECASS